MLTAQEKKKNNIVEYILYMWQIMDLIRACRFNADQIKTNIVDRSGLKEQDSEKLLQWYTGLASTMKQEGLQQKGNLSDIGFILSELSFLHNALINVFQDQAYQNAYTEAVPFLKELFNKPGQNYRSEVEACMQVLYGYYLIKLQRKTANPSTKEAIGSFSKLLGILAKKYNDMKTGNLLLDKHKIN